jgi:hypothetical protein
VGDSSGGGLSRGRFIRGECDGIWGGQWGEQERGGDCECLYVYFIHACINCIFGVMYMYVYAYFLLYMVPCICVYTIYIYMCIYIFVN